MGDLFSKEEIPQKKKLGREKKVENESLRKREIMQPEGRQVK